MAEIANNQFYIAPYTNDGSITLSFYDIESVECLAEGQNEWHSNPSTITTNGKIYIRNLNYERRNSRQSPFKVSGKFKVGGDIVSLLGEMFDDYYGYYAMGLFSNCSSLVLASDLILSPSWLGEGAYFSMFYRCTSLLYGPIELPASIATVSCYGEMFYGCSSLLNTPQIQAHTLKGYACEKMFYNCSAITSITLAATIIEDYALDNWVYGVKTTNGVIYKHPQVVLSEGVSGYPSGWTVNNIEADYAYFPVSEIITSSFSQKTINIESNTNWVLEFDSSLIDVSKTNGFGNDIITLYPKTNDPNSYNITYTITVRVNDFTYNTATITQHCIPEDCFYIEPLEEGCTFSLKCSEYKVTCDIIGGEDAFLLYSLNSGETRNYDTKLYFKNLKVDNGGDYYSPSTLKFYLKGKCKIGGNYSNLVGNKFSRGGNNTFAYCDIVDASDLVIGNISEGYTASNTYARMFQHCTLLEYPPQLNFTIVKFGGCTRMFEGCTSLKYAPDLTTAVELWGSAYKKMFKDCTSLTCTPKFATPAYTDNGIYEAMFAWCTSLKSAILPSIIQVKDGFYTGMFVGCTSLSYVKMTSEGAYCNGVYGNWEPAFYGTVDMGENSVFVKYGWLDFVSDNGVFVKSPNNTDITQDGVIIPLGWTVYNEGDANEPDEPECDCDDDNTGSGSGGTNTDITPNNSYFWVQFERIGGGISGIIDDSTDMYYSFDGSTWLKAEYTLNLGRNTLVYFKNNTKTLNDVHFKFNSNVKIGGDLSSLTNMYDICCEYLFEDNIYLTDASKLILPWKTLAKNCYDSMFRGCTSLTTAPSLPATTLAEYCYYRMFEGCTSLKTAPELPATTLAKDCYHNMFYDCASLTTAPELPLTTLYESCYSAMFSGCESLIAAPELPATTLADDCYRSMFGGCTSLTTAPELPATTLRVLCYAYMFDGCTNLNYIKMLATDISADRCLDDWVKNVAPTGTFIKHPDNRKIPTGSIDGIPVGWTVYNEGDPNIPEPEIPTPPVDPDNPGGGGGEDPDNPNPPVGPDNPGGGGGEGGDTSGTTGTITSKTITIDNSAQDVEISVEQTNIALWTDVVIEEGDAYASLEGYDFTDSKITLEVNQNRSQTTRNIVIHIYAIDVNDNIVEGVITVVQDAYDVPIVPPEEITIPDIMLYKTRLDFSATGGSLSVQVDYRNATTINTPTCSQSWVSIRQSGGGGYYFEDDGSRVDQRLWVITMEETQFYRSAPIIFSCTNNVGTIFEEDKFMVYQTGPTTEDVEGDSYILVPKKEILLREIGESEEIIITYANVADIVAPEVPEGYEITEISRTQIDGNTIEVKYKITKIEDSKDDAKVIFKAQGKGGSEVKSDTTIKGWTPPTEPATVELPEIDLDNGVLVFEHTGGTRTIRLTIDGYTKPMSVNVSIWDDNYNVHLIRNESDYDDGYDYCVWELDFESDGNTTNNPYEGTIDVHYTDGLTDKTISFPFYVRYEGEGLIKEFSNNFKFDKDGELLSMSDNIGVGYLNIMTYHIPTHPDWIIIGTPTDGGASVSYDKVYRYPISVQPNEGVERTGIVRISGIGKDGKEYYTEVSVLQEGTNTEVIIDEGFIELQSLSVTLPAEGGSETFQVKYYDLQELLEPEFVGDWATIEKVSETSEDGVAWNGEECVVTTVTYKATAQATTYGRQAKVIFKSYINYGDGGKLYMEKDKFRVNQLAPNATGTMGTVFAFSNNITVDSRGFAAGDTIWKEARVGYKDVTIEYPVIDVDWFRIAKIVDKGSSKEYDALKYYELEFDKNLSALSRTGTITFKGKNEDGTYTTAIVRVVQLGEEPVDPETGLAHNYKGYFKSLDCTLYSVSLITQPGYDSYEEIILAGDSPVVVSYTESDRLYEPLRTSTCTIKVVSSSYLMNLYSGKAQGTQVVVKNEDTGEIEWCGFLQPNLYNQGFSAPVETIEFEASDCLNTLQYIDYSDVYSNGRFVVTFKEIIDDIMDRCKLINSYYVTQKMYSDTFQSKTMDFVNFYISEYNFYSEEEEPWKLKEVLEEICKYMGYVCFQWGDSVYFMDYDMYKEKKMNGARWDKSTRWNTKNAVLISEKANEIVADSYMGTGASMSLDDVFNSVKVNCNYYNVDDLIPDLFEDDYLTNRHGENAVISISRYGGRGNSILMNKTFYRVYDHKFINSLYYSPVTSTSFHETKVVPTEEQFKDRFFFRDFIGGNIVDMVHLNYSEANEKVGESKDLERYLLISQLNRPWCGAEGTFHWEDYNFPIMEYKNIPVIFIDNTAEDETTRTATRATSSSRPNTRPQKKVPMPNYLVINASAAFVADMSGEYLSDTIEKGLGKKSSQSWYTYGGSSIDQVRNAPALCFYLEIPQAGWWNGSTWVDYKTHFEVPLDYFGEGADDNKYYEQLWATDKDVTNNIETYLFLGTTGYRIPLPKVMDTTRDMYFAIAMPKRFVHCADSSGGDNTGKIGNAYCFIKDLEMKIVNRNTIFYENDEDEVYENVVDSAFVTEGEEIDLKITSDNYKRFSYSTVSTRTAEDVPTTDIQFYNKNMELRKPEEAIIERYVDQYSTPSIKTSLTLDMSFKPYELITDTYWKKDFVITGQEIDYKNASQTITLLEKK